MNFALLGFTPAVRPILQALRAASGHQLVHAVNVGQALAELLLDFPGLRSSENWSDLFDTASVDFVIVAGSAPEVLEGTRNLAAAGQSLALVPEVGQGLDLIYELSLIQDDNHVTLLPVMPLRTHSQLLLLREALMREELGELLHLEFERFSSSPLFGATDRDRCFLDDVAVLRWLAGNYSQITATESRSENDGISRSTAALAGTGCPAAAWTLRSGSPQDRWCLAVVGERGSIQLECDVESGAMQLTSNTLTFPESGTAGPSDAQVAAQALVDGLAVDADRPKTFPEWDELTKVFETADAVRRSLRRRRTIDLHFEQASERGLFKTQMAALGCGVLMFTLFGLVAYLIVASLFELPVAVLQTLRALWMLPLFVYLLLQGLLLITRPSRRKTEPTASVSGDAQ